MLKIDNISHLISILLISILVFIIYSNTFEAPFHFDDDAHISSNKNLHLNELSPENILTSMKGPSGDVSRPVSRLTLAFNWYIGKEKTAGYHIVNTAIHSCTAIFLYLFIFYLLNTPKLSNRYSPICRSVALLSAVLWAIHPLQTQSVTYVIQRMASMAGMFYIIAMFCYLKARSEPTKSYKSIIYYGILIICFFLGLGSKENIVMLPFSILAIEILFFGKSSLLATISSKRIIYGILAGTILGIFSTFIILDFSDLGWKLLNGYNARPFSLLERLLTEPRILIFYLGLFFYPIANRFSLEHDVIISQSIFSPWSTSPALLILLLLIGCAIFYSRKKPVLSFAIFFYIANHIIESSIIPLELIFEHRNYIPTMFLPLATILFIHDYTLKTNNRYLSNKVFLFFTGAIALVVISLGSYTRNSVWKDKESFLLDNLKHAQNKGRTYYNLANYYHKYQKDYDPVLVESLYKKSMKLYSPTNEYLLFMGNYSLAGLEIKHYGDIRQGVKYLEKAVDFAPENLDARIDLATFLLNENRYVEALHHSSILLDDEKHNQLSYRLPIKSKVKLIQLKTLSYLWMSNYDRALSTILQALSLEIDNFRSLALFGSCLSKVHKYDIADSYLNKAINILGGKNITIHLMLLENSLAANNQSLIEQYAKHLLLNYPLKDLFKTVSNSTPENDLPPMNYSIVKPVLVKYYAKMSPSTILSDSTQ